VVVCDGRTRDTSSPRRTDARHVIAAVPAHTSWPDAAVTFQAMTDWQIIIGSSLVALAIVTLLAVALLGPPTLG